MGDEQKFNRAFSRPSVILLRRVPVLSDRQTLHPGSVPRKTWLPGPPGNQESHAIAPDIFYHSLEH